MTYTRPSLLLSAACIIIITRITIAIDIGCNIPRDFKVKISEQERAGISQGKLNVRVEPDELKVTAYQGTDSLEVRADQVILTFTGYLTIDDGNGSIANEPEQFIFEKYVDRISGMAHPEMPNFVESATGDCRLVLLPTNPSSARVHPSVASKIRRLAESCVEFEICSRISSMRFDNVELSSRAREMELFSVHNTNVPAINAIPPSFPIKRSSSNATCDSAVVQTTINKLVDIAIAELIEKLKTTNGGIVNVPNMDYRFSQGTGIFKINGHFEATDGTFRDVTTIRRRSDAVLSHDRFKFIGSCEIGLDIANLRYDHYRLKYGITVNGRMSVNIAGIALEARISVDYNGKPCTARLEHLRVTEFGNMKIDLSGLGPLNWFPSWVTKTYHNDIVKGLEENVRNTVVSRLSSFDCERFRP